MRSVVVATDFSTRSDRAIRRGVLIAKTSNAELRLVHAVDDDQPRRLIEIECAEAQRLLASQAETLRKLDSVEASFSVTLGDPFSSVTQAASDFGCDLLVIGPHRRQLLKDAFVGTTAERIIRTSRAPVVMANATPASPYRHILVAVDFSDSSASALRLVAGMDWGDTPAISVVHCFDPPEQTMRGMLVVSDEDMIRYLADARARASAELASFLRDVQIRPVRQTVETIRTDASAAIRSVASSAGADLIVVGQRGRSGFAKVMLGSVAEAVLRSAEVDVLAAPRDTAAAS
ncbi:MAG: universal stress protein [Beijerinckiaceae bacterium]